MREFTEQELVRPIHLTVTSFVWVNITFPFTPTISPTSADVKMYLGSEHI